MSSPTRPGQVPQLAMDQAPDAWSWTCFEIGCVAHTMTAPTAELTRAWHGHGAPRPPRSGSVESDDAD